MKKIAVDINLFEGNDGYRGFGPLGFETKAPGEAPSLLASFISTAIGLITVIAIIWFVFQFFTGVVAIISSGGDKAALETAKKKITTGVIGLAATIFAIFIIRLTGTILGIPDILNLANLLNAIQIK